MLLEAGSPAGDAVWPVAVLAGGFAVLAVALIVLTARRRRARKLLRAEQRRSVEVGLERINEV